MSLAGHMTPVLPRHSVPNISGNKDLDDIFQDLATPFAVWLLERPLSSLPRVFANTNIVVVGASRTGLAFIEALIMGPSSQYLTFTNITLVSEHGLPTATECLKAALTCVPQVGRYTDRYLKSVPFYYYVDVIPGVMVNIDRKMKCIHLKGGGVKYYDELVLTCGHQFQHPEYLHQSLELIKEIRIGKPCERTLMDDPSYRPDEVPPPPVLPENFMLVNCLFDANTSLKKLLRMINDDKDTAHCLSEENPVVVFGSCLESYNCLAALLELGLAPRLITFVEHFPCSYGMRVNCFNNELIDERVQANIESIGIRVIREVSLAGWRQVDNRVEAIHIMTPLHALRLPCFAFFYYGLKSIDIHAFKAINECGLVYDGGLIVGPMFDTNDPHVFGAGPCVKYSRRLYADRLQQAYYCSEDVGEALAAMFLHKLDPFVMSDRSGLGNDLLAYNSSVLLHNSSFPANIGPSGIFVRWQPVYKFHSPIVQYSVLPGPLYYLKLRKPGPEIPMEVQHYLPRQGHILTTDKRGNYFRLRINALHVIEEVTCLSKKNFSPQILCQLYGKHEAFFHQLLYRYESDMIEDLYEYFTQPWMAAMYQETFGELLQDINEQDIPAVFKMVRTKFQEDDKSEVIGQRTCASDPSCKELQNIGTFRSLIDKFVSRTSTSMTSMTLSPLNLDIPSECGQSRRLRGSAYGFWTAVGGERLVLAHVARYLSRHSGVNLHYARPREHE